MERQIKQELFDPASTLKEEQTVQLSVKDWKTLLSKWDRTQAQVSACDEKIKKIRSQCLDWLCRVKEKIEDLSKSHQELSMSTQKEIQQWQKAFQDYLQPQQRQAERREINHTMHRHTQFIQGYAQNLDSLKKSLSRNEYHISQLMAEMKTLRVDLDLMKSRPSSSIKVNKTSLSSNDSLYV